MDPFLNILKTHAKECASTQVEHLNRFSLINRNGSTSLDKLYELMSYGFYDKNLVTCTHKNYAIPSGETRTVGQCLWVLKSNYECFSASNQDKHHMVYKNNTDSWFDDVWFFFLSLCTIIRNDRPLPFTLENYVHKYFGQVDDHPDYSQPNFMAHLTTLLYLYCVTCTIDTSENLCTASCGNVKVNIQKFPHNAPSQRFAIFIFWPIGDEQTKTRANQMMQTILDTMEENETLRHVLYPSVSPSLLPTES